MTAWDEVKLALLDLQDTGALALHPDPRGTEDRLPPIETMLAPWATDAAADLRRRFGDDVKLVVGVLSYPSMRPSMWSPRNRAEIATAEPKEFLFELEHGVEVRSGHRTEAGLRVGNLTEAEITVLTTGHLTAAVIDPATGDCVGIEGSAQRARLVRFDVPAYGDTVIPLLIGTVSLRPELGYAVPPGQWAVSTDLELEDGRVLRTPPMPITVTA